MILLKALVCLLIIILSIGIIILLTTWRLSKITKKGESVEIFAKFFNPRGLSLIFTHGEDGSGEFTLIGFKDNDL